MTASIPLVTVTLGTSAELAQKIAAGLHSGAYELVGGVVRDAESKQVVAWLRQVGDISPAALPVHQIGTLALQTLVASTSLLALGVTVAGFALVTKRLDAIAKDLSTIRQTLERIEMTLLNWVLNRDKIAARFLARLTDAYTQIETIYAAVRGIEGYRLELEQIEGIGLSLVELDQQSALLSSGSSSASGDRHLRAKPPVPAHPLGCCCIPALLPLPR